MMVIAEEFDAQLSGRGLYATTTLQVYTTYRKPCAPTNTRPVKLPTPHTIKSGLALATQTPTLLSFSFLGATGVRADS